MESIADTIWFRSLTFVPPTLSSYQFGRVPPPEGKNMQSGSVSVLTPSLNAGTFIADAVESVHAQDRPTWLDVEQLIFDGGSTDNTSAVIASGADRWRHLIFRSAPDRGQSDALNAAFRHSTGDIIGWLNADEFYMPHTLDRIAAMFRRMPSVDVIYGDVAVCDALGRLVRLRTHHAFSNPVLRWYGCYIGSCSTFIRRSALPTDGPWEDSLRRIMDWELWLRLAAADGRFRYEPHVLGVFRLHDEQVTAGVNDFYSDEHTAVRRRYHIGGSKGVLAAKRVAGRGLRVLLKSADGGTIRETRALQSSGRSLRWFAAAETERWSLPWE